MVSKFDPENTKIFIMADSDADLVYIYMYLDTVY